MREFKEVLKELKSQTGLTNNHLSKLLSIGTVSVEAMETGYIQPSMDILLRMADIFHVSLEYIVGGTLDQACREDLDVKEIFLVGGFSGPDYTVALKDILGSVFINRHELHGKEFLAYSVMDDAMSKSRIFKGDVLIVRRQSYADNGDLVLAVLDGDKEIVRRYRRTGNIITLTAEGDSLKFPPIKIDEREAKLKILGKVHEVRIKL